MYFTLAVSAASREVCAALTGTALDAAVLKTLSNGDKFLRNLPRLRERCLQHGWLGKNVFEISSLNDAAFLLRHRRLLVFWKR